LLDQVEEWVKSGIKVYSCYEAGVCGYWYHRELIKRGALNFVVVPRRLESQYSKRQKTDRLDARSLLNNLESYLRGNRNAMSIVAVPTPEQEQERSVVRHREQLMRNRPWKHEGKILDRRKRISLEGTITGYRHLRN
jgi:transposase